MNEKQNIEIDQKLRKADSTWNVAVISQVIAHIQQKYSEVTLSDIEAGFRSFNSNTYLIAKPKRFAPIGYASRFFSGKPSEYWLWICLHGRDEMLEELAKQGMTLEENMAALNHTGVLFINTPDKKKIQFN